MSARDRMLARIRERQGKPAEPQPAEIESVRAHLASHPRNPAPRETWDAVTRFRERALALASTLDEVESIGAVPATVARYLGEAKLGGAAVCWRELGDLDWARAGLTVEARAAAIWWELPARCARSPRPERS